MKSKALTDWVAEVATHTQPGSIHWCDGSATEAVALEEHMVANGTLIRLNEKKFPRSFLHRSHPTDVARTEHLTFISTQKRDDAGPTNNWMSIEEAERTVWPLFEGAMKERTMFVVPYIMGPEGSPYSRIGVEITDSPYVVLNLRIMARIGNAALGQLGANPEFVRGLHSLGDLSPERRFIVHFPQTRTI